jgi:transcriptional regulator with XRE-family HTH domain
LREKRNFSQAELAELCGVSQNHISQIERGIRGLSRKKLGIFAKTLDTSIAYIMGETDDSSPPSELPTVNIAIAEGNSLLARDIAEIEGNNNTVAMGHATMPTSIHQKETVKSMSYWGEVTDEAEKVAERRNPKEIKRVAFALKEALNTVENAENNI